MRLPTVLVVIVVLALLVVLLPAWTPGLGFNLFPSGLLLTIVCIVLLLWLFVWRRVPPL